MPGTEALRNLICHTHKLIVVVNINHTAHTHTHNIIIPMVGACQKWGGSAPSLFRVGGGGGGGQLPPPCPPYVSTPGYALGTVSANFEELGSTFSIQNGSNNVFLKEVSFGKTL